MRDGGRGEQNEGKKGELGLVCKKKTLNIFLKKTLITVQSQAMFLSTDESPLLHKA